ncbi:hypothetical protein E2C01_068633 [Portunus trituberculatus]|uniref:Uncharacterized protein n=1 Tax=Portunus trituberculatus TaxID=210409 RepID=A0A5B7HX19_PORTR|nr:hypothetical protein [Portunus trituberculatus]
MPEYKRQSQTHTFPSPPRPAFPLPARWSCLLRFTVHSSQVPRFRSPAVFVESSLLPRFLPSVLSFFSPSRSLFSF